MSDSAPVRAELLQIVTRRLLPWAQDRAAPIILFQPPFRVPDSVEVLPVESPLLSSRSRVHSGVTRRWRSAALNAGAYPGICCVLEGEAERRIGVTRAMIQANDRLDVRHGCYLIRLPQQTFSVVPPGVPVDDGTVPHWFRDARQAPDSLIFWITCTPQGIEMHLCRTASGEHSTFYPAFIQDPHALTIAELLIDDLRSTATETPVSLRHYLQILLLRIEQALQGQEGLLMAVGENPAQIYEHELRKEKAQAASIQKACRFIDSYLATPLTVQQIADHLYISPTQLNRLFQRELGVSPMAYVNQSRMKLARSLLLDTNHTIQYISNFFGYTHPDVFSRAFKKYSGLSPVQFRKTGQRD